MHLKFQRLLAEAYRDIKKKAEAKTKRTTDKDSQGYGVGIAEPGFCFHQAVLTGSHNYLLHYNLTIVEGDAIIAHVSRNGLENNLKKVNDAKILEYCDFLTKIPTF